MAQIGFGEDQAVLSKVKDYLHLAALDKVLLSPAFFRDYKCFENCGACCNHPNLSLEYIKDSDRWSGFNEKYPTESQLFYEVEDESGTTVMRYRQEKNTSHPNRCQLLDDKGLCTIHDNAPFPCKFAFSKFKDFSSSKGFSRLTTEGYGRAWNFNRLDGTKGAMCYMTTFSYDKLLVDLQNLKELRKYGEMLQIPTKLKYIIEFIENSLPVFEKEGITFTEQIEFEQLNCY